MLPGGGARAHPVGAEPRTARPSRQPLATAGPLPPSWASLLLRAPPPGPTAPGLPIWAQHTFHVPSGHSITKALPQAIPATPGWSVPEPTTLRLPLSVVSEPGPETGAAGSSRWQVYFFPFGFPRTLTLQVLLTSWVAQETHFPPANWRQCPNPPTIGIYAWCSPTPHHSQCTDYFQLLRVPYFAELAMNPSLLRSFRVLGKCGGDGFLFWLEVGRTVPTE